MSLHIFIEVKRSNLLSNKTDIIRTAAPVIILTWRQNLHNLEIVKASMEFQVPRMNLTVITWPALSVKKIIIFCLDAKKYVSES